MNTIPLIEMLPRILSTELLSAHHKKFAADLGYNTKSSIDRLRQGVAGEKACASFLDKLRDNLGTGPAELQLMHTMLTDYDILAASMKRHGVTLSPEFTLMSLISGDFSGFPREWCDAMVHEMQDYAERNPDCYYLMLFYHYLRKSHPSLSVKNLTFRQAAGELVEPVARRLQALYPATEVGHEYAALLRQQDENETEPHLVLWRCILAGARLLKFYGQPESYLKARNAMRLLPGVDERSYWLTSDPTRLLMMLTIPAKREGSGSYGIFQPEFATSTLRMLGQLCLLSDGHAQLVPYGGDRYLMPAYAYDTRRGLLEFRPLLDPDSLRREGFGNAWQKMEIDNNIEVQEFDSALTDMAIQDAINAAHGVEPIEGMEVEDVVLTRREVRLRVESGRELVIDRDAHAFLRDIKPTDTVVVRRHVESGLEYVGWTDRDQVVPLAEFRIV